MISLVLLSLIAGLGIFAAFCGVCAVLERGRR